MKKRNNGEHAGYTWERPPQQRTDVKFCIPTSARTFPLRLELDAARRTERRASREAFNFSENSYGHWLPLMLADRIGVVEGVIDDLSRGHIRIFSANSAGKPNGKHNRANLVTKGRSRRACYRRGRRVSAQRERRRTFGGLFLTEFQNPSLK
jgi:hypothetical protein